MKIDKSEIELTLTPEDIGDLITLNNFYQGLIYYCMEHIDNFDDAVQAYMKSQSRQYISTRQEELEEQEHE